MAVSQPGRREDRQRSTGTAFHTFRDDRDSLPRSASLTRNDMQRPVLPLRQPPAMSLRGAQRRSNLLASAAGLPKRGPGGGVSRREFIKGTAAVAAFTVVPRHVLGGPRQIPPSEKLNIAGIGVGGQGAWDLQGVSSENIVALCDVDRRHAAQTFQKFPNARQYSDFRVMLETEDKSIDAVVVATPDHTHAVASMMAVKMGKHVYCDKPFNHESYPQASIVRCEFPAREGLPPVELTWYDGGLMPPRPPELEPGRRLGDKLGGVIFVGDSGKLICDSYGNSPRLIPETRMKEYPRPERTIPRSAGHHKEWIEACKGGRPAGSNFDYAGPLTEMVLLGNIAVRMSLKTQEKGLRLAYDGPNMRITNLPEANEFLHRQYRQGWTL